ncbi:hypothetical protein EON83_27690 [bacterium]|nr:MAG: hypothetical protein EON83_27690 [bacterium]
MKRWRLLLLLLPLVVGALYLRSLASWRPQKVFVGAGPISQLLFSNDGKTLLVGHSPIVTVLSSTQASTPTLVTLLDVNNSFKPLWQRDKGLPSGLIPQFFAADSKILLHGSDIQTLDAKTGRTLKTSGSLYGRAVMSPDGSWLAVNRSDTDDGRVYLNPQPLEQGHDEVRAEKIIGNKGDLSTEFTFSPDGKTFVVGTGSWQGAHLDFYDVKTWKRTKSWNDTPRNPKDEKPRSYYEILQWSRDGKFILSYWSCTEGGAMLTLWRVSDGKKLATSPTIDLSPELQDGGSVLSYSDKERVFLRKVPNLTSGGEELLHIANELITTVTLSPDGSYLVIGTTSGRVFWKRVK